MIAAAMLLALAGQSDATDDPVANWTCARPLISKNALRKIDGKQLSLRISDECTKPFVLSSDARKYGGVLAIQERNIYALKTRNFAEEIENRIYQKRREASITLRR